MTASCVQGAFAQFAVKQGTGDVSFSSGATRLPFYHENFQCLDTVGVPDVIVGSRTVPGERARRGPKLTRGTILLPVCANELDTLLPLICGANESANVFALAETVPTFAALFDKVSEIYKYKDGVVDSAVFRGVQAGPGAPPNFVTLMLKCLFKDEDDEAASFPTMSLGISAGFSPYVFEDSVTTFDDVEVQPMAWTIAIRNFIEQRYVASLTPVTNCPARRAVTASFRFAADADHIGYRKIATEGFAGSVELTNGSASTAFDFACMQAPRETPVITGHTEVKFDFNTVCRGLSTTKELIITNVSV